MDSQRYDELHGSNNWDGLLDPFDLDLRNLLIGYGDLSSAAERAFNNDEGSLYAGYSCYGKSSFFKGVMLPWADSKYQVTSFIYATARVDSILPLLFPSISREGSEFESNWMGYVAVSSDEYSEFIGRREICVVWRGTVTTYEWIDDIAGAEPVSAEPLLPSANSTDPDTPKVMGGWLTIYNTSDPNSEFIPSSARTQLLERIKELLGKYKNEKVSITCTGHSLGACLAVLSAFDIARNVVTPDINVSAFIFACPQVGNQSFKEKTEELPNLKILRVKNDPDIIPFWPSKIIKWVSENIWESVPSELLEYVDVGVELWINSKNSPYLKEESKLNGMLHPLVYHNLQGMLHTLSGWNGKNGDFDWGLVKRSLGWVNMSNDLLKKEFKVPVSWWAEKNKAMVLNDHGDWVLAPLDRHDHDLPM
ncbi:putative phospholipase A(1) [Helianthus annuus]|uniref:Phospholipase A1 n=1 Tax=Helianthus annuus TaxID=4232 RepID=A0A251UKF0_HELAN|nr:phospholipase A1-IIdelta [Helianthus annuus]KAF5817509.1 putative phospholipase A(1) [Helianthus annuus]KAJ0776438.1 putative phospholipase A(1) [Helianthus annuus]KAJ0950841.1 putative phospholipase A(1) [Helianthus annuus]